MALLTAFLVLIFCYSLWCAVFERTIITAPILFTAAGMIFLLFAPKVPQRNEAMDVFLWLAEIGLVLLLFADASHANLRVLADIRNLPARLLSVGMLLTIFLGAVCALLVFPQLSIWEAGILAAILAPTDAGLGQIIVSSPRVPMQIRQALNVEAGLNDGLSVPFLIFFIGLAAGATGEKHGLLRVIFEQLVLGALIGLIIGFVGGWLLALARRKRWMTKPSEHRAVVVLPLLCVIASEEFHASMFIAAFIAGLATRLKFQDAGEDSVEFTEEWGQLFNLSVFFFFGVLIAKAWPRFNNAILLYAILSLTVVRMVPVAISLMGTRLSRATLLFMGWFGPRGLASIVLGLIYLEHEARLPGEDTIRLSVMMTVLLSIFLHGFSALPGMKFYATKIATLGPNAPENVPT